MYKQTQSMEKLYFILKMLDFQIIQIHIGNLIILKVYIKENNIELN